MKFFNCTIVRYTAKNPKLGVYSPPSLGKTVRLKYLLVSSMLEYFTERDVSRTHNNEGTDTDSVSATVTCLFGKN